MLSNQPHTQASIAQAQKKSKNNGKFQFPKAEDISLMMEIPKNIKRKHIYLYICLYLLNINTVYIYTYIYIYMCMLTPQDLPY